MGYLFPLEIRLSFLSAGNKIRSGYYSRKLKIGKGVTLYPDFTVISPHNIFIGDNTRIGFRATISSWPSSPTDDYLIMIGKDCSIGDDVHITSSNSVIIGNIVLIGKMVTITEFTWTM